MAPLLAVMDGCEPLQSYFALDFVGQRVGAVYLAQRFDHSGGVDGDGAVLCAVVDEVARQGLDVAIEDQADEFAIAIDDGRAGVAADDVAGGDEVDRSGEVESCRARPLPSVSGQRATCH